MSKNSKGIQGETKSATSKNKDEIVQLKEELKKMKLERTNQTKKITDLTKTVKKLETELTNAKHGLASRAPNYLDVISADVKESYQEQMKQLEDENQRLKSRHNATETGNEEEIAKMKKEIQELKSEMDSIKKENKSYVERNQELEQNNQTLQKKKQPKGISRHGSDTEPEKSDSNTLKENLQECRNKLKQQEEIWKGLDEENRMVKEDNERLKAKIAAKNKQTEGDMETKDTFAKQLNGQENEILKLKKEKEDLEKKMKTKEEEFEQMRQTLQSERKTKDDELEQMRQTLQSERKTKDEELEQMRQTLQSESNEQKNGVSKLKKEKEDLEREMKTKDKELNQMRQTLQSESNKQENEISILKREKENLEKEIREQKKENKKGEKSSSAEKISRLEDEVEGLRNRLSKIAGAQLVDNNPAIADLSDPNRPLNLGEKFSELYDNEWTDAMEELSDSLDERAVIKQLLEIVVDSYKFCCDRSNDFMKKINGTLQIFSSDLVPEKMSKEISKTNKDFRKSLAVHLVSPLQEEFTKPKLRANAGKKTKAYMKKCVHVCWFMTVQDPKVVINHEKTDHFDEERFKAYTKKGKYVDYMVWPALHLHEGGPMIGKGVAQGK